MDGFFYNGCERVEDTWDQQNRGDSCGHSSSQAVNIDSDMWENENHYVTANILPSGDRDWWKVKPRDGGTPGRDFSIDVRFSSNPGHNMAGGTHRFSVYRDSCGNRVCYNASVFQKRTNFNKNGGGCTNGNQCGHVGNQNCTSTAGNNHCGSSTRKCCHHSSDNNRWFFVEVWHTSGRAMNADYQLRFSNNHY